MGSETNAEFMRRMEERLEKTRIFLALQIDSNDFVRLFNQTERAKELEQQNSQLCVDIEFIRIENEGLKNLNRKMEKEIIRLREALEEIFELSKHDGHSHYLDKCYVVARKALSGASNG